MVLNFKQFSLNENTDVNLSKIIFDGLTRYPGNTHYSNLCTTNTFNNIFKGKLVKFYCLKRSVGNEIDPYGEDDWDIDINDTIEILVDRVSFKREPLSINYELHFYSGDVDYLVCTKHWAEIIEKVNEGHYADRQHYIYLKDFILELIENGETLEDINKNLKSNIIGKEVEYRKVGTPLPIGSRIRRCIIDDLHFTLGQFAKYCLTFHEKNGEWIPVDVERTIALVNVPDKIKEEDIEWFKKKIIFKC
jgi:hypothetical protein